MLWIGSKETIGEQYSKHCKTTLIVVGVLPWTSKTGFSIWGSTLKPNGG